MYTRQEKSFLNLLDKKLLSVDMSTAKFAKALHEKLNEAEQQRRIPDGLFDCLSVKALNVHSNNDEFINEAAEKACEIIIRTWDLAYQNFSAEFAKKILGEISFTYQV